jgi:ABC-type dipeptide/oligopeptide/nickel transport system permease component
VEYLVVQSGPRALEVLLRRWKELGNFDRAFRATFGITTAQFEEGWRRYVKDRYGWLFVLSHSAVFWMFLSLMLVAMAGVRRRARRDRMARLRAADIADRPRFWLTHDGLQDDDSGPDPDGSE